MRTLSVFVQCGKVNNRPGMDKSAHYELCGCFTLGRHSAYIYKEKADLTAIKKGNHYDLSNRGNGLRFSCRGI